MQERPGIDECVDQYMERVRLEAKYSEQTLSTYRWTLRSMVRDLASLAHRCPQEVTENTLLEWLAMGRSQGLAPSTIAKRVAAARGFFKFALEEGWIPSNPARHLRPPKVPRGLPRPLSVEQVENLIRAPDTSTFRGKRDRAFIEFLYGTGCRVGAAVSLDVDNLDLDNGVARVWEKGGKHRILHMGASAVKAMRVWIEARAREGNPSKEARWALWLNLGHTKDMMDAGRLTKDQAAALVSKAGREAQLERHVTPHVLRHSFATHLLAAGVDVLYVAKFLGHSSVASTQIYAGMDPLTIQKALRAHPRGRDLSPGSEAGALET